MTSGKLQHHPAGIIICLALCELATSYHSSIFMWGSENVIKFLTIDKMRIWEYVNLSSYVTLVTCGINVIFFALGVITGILYNIVLCLDLILSLRNPFATGSKRMKYYNLFVIVFTAGISGYVIINFLQSTCIDDDNEKISFHNKLNFVGSQKEIFQPMIGFFVALAVISIGYAGYRMKFGLKISNVAFKSSFVRHIMYVAVNIFIFGFVLITIEVMKSEDESGYAEAVENAAGYVMSLGGVIITIIRCTDQNFRSKISSGKLFEVEAGENEDNEWNNSLAQLTQELKTEVASNIFDSLFMVYNQKTAPTGEVPNFKKNSSRSVKKYNRELRNSKLAEGLYLDSDSIKSSIVEYCPEVFDSIIYNSGLNFNVLKKSINPLENFGSISEASESKGKSGSFFMKTVDDKFIIKTVKESEVKAIKSMIVEYEAHLRENKQSLLCKIFGAFLMNFPGITPIYIIIMENVIENMNPTVIYDLKGSTLGRKTDIKYTVPGEKLPIGPYKDLDYIRNKKKIKCNNIQQLAYTMHSDTHFLQKWNLMDYSLLLCIEEFEHEGKVNKGSVIITYKIIDYLTKYGLFKKLERAFTILINPKKSDQASVIDSKKYADRFTRFMLNRVFENKYN